MVFVYNDEGVSSESLFHTLDMLHSFSIDCCTIDATGVCRGEWCFSAKLFVIPGGADIPYTQLLNGSGNKTIKNYVRNGGAYLGICAGAYYATSRIIFFNNDASVIDENRELKFFNGIAVGPILSPYDSRNHSGSTGATIRTSMTTCKYSTVYYNGGCTFLKSNPNEAIKVLANYYNNSPAIIMTRYGKGKSVLSGIHFEYNPYLLNNKNQYTSLFIDRLIEENSSRLEICAYILNLLI